MDKPYYQDEWLKHYCGDCLTILPELPDESVDLLATDPPYGISFMGKDWDKALPDIKVWKECYRVLKAGSFAFVMSIPRADCLSRMIISLEDAGFWVNFTPIFWAYASGFPKAQNIGKAVDKRLGSEREVIGMRNPFPPDHPRPNKDLKRWADKLAQCKDRNNCYGEYGISVTRDGIPITAPATPQAKSLDGSYGGFQPKPAVEVIIVAMKPLSEKTFVDQALKNQKGITWLDDGRIPYDGLIGKRSTGGFNAQSEIYHNDEKYEIKNQDYDIRGGRFPANLLVSDDALNDGRVSKGTIRKPTGKGILNPETGWNDNSMIDKTTRGQGDSGSFSRYFDLDKWWAKTFPFLIVPKASKSEKNKGLGDLPEKQIRYEDGSWGSLEIFSNKYTKESGNPSNRGKTPLHRNNHPTVKPLKLMSYLITLGSREGDTVLDPYMGSGTTPLACQLLNRHCIGIEIEERYCEISAKRCSQRVFDLTSVTLKIPPNRATINKE